MVAADKTNEHGGSSANPPAASLDDERNMIAIKMLPDLNLMTNLDGLLLARSRRSCAEGTSRFVNNQERAEPYQLARVDVP